MNPHVANAVAAGGERVLFLDENAPWAVLGRLERVEEGARGIARSAETLEDPRHLGQAVEIAGEVVDEALSLGCDLLEAFRAAQEGSTRAISIETATGTEAGAHDPDPKTQRGSGGSR